MVRFTDKEVYTTRIDDINRMHLISHFRQKGHSRDIIIVYDEKDCFFGVITYKSLLKSPEGGISKVFYVLKDNNGEMWKDLHDIFDTHDVEYIPIYNGSKELLYFAYNDEGEGYDFIEGNFTQLEINKKILFIQDIYPRVQKVYIYDLNEWSFRFYLLLKEWDIPVKLNGEKWIVFFGDCIAEDEDVVEEYRMNIYSEGTYFIHELIDAASKYPYEPIRCWGFLNEIIHINRIYYTLLNKHKFEECQIRFLTAYFPDFQDLEKYTVDEHYRLVTGVFPAREDLDWEYLLNREQIEATGGYKSKEEFLEISNSKEKSFLNVKGKRLDYKKFGKGKYNIYLIGLCIMSGYNVDDESSFGCYFYEEISKITDEYSVIAIGTSRFDFDVFKDIFKVLTIKKNDMILCFDLNSKRSHDIIEYQQDIDIKQIIDSRHADWFFNEPIHTNQLGNKEIAKKIVELYVKDIASIEEESVDEYIQIGRKELTKQEEEELNLYIENVEFKDIPEECNVGAIVMNCNPMTNGHLHLIDYARKAVDFLYIFIVEEDKSEFPFKDRIDIVRRTVSNWENVKVVPSGQFVLSFNTMPLYFEKAQRQEEILDATNDVIIFCQEIASKLNISKRFVGEEPIDLVTRQYNESMREILPIYQIEFIEIPRLECDSHVISASEVRRLMNEKKYEEISKLVPKVTYDYLCSKVID